MTASIKDVARIAGVSTATVSHVINQTRFVSDEVKDRVAEAMNELHYRPNQIARSLRSQKTRTVALLIPDISNFYYTSVAEGVEVTLRKNGYHVVLSNSHEKIEVEKKMIEVFNSLLLEGLIMIPALGEHSFLNKALSGSYPVVFVDRKPQGYEGDCVLLDNMNATLEATKLFIAKGHRVIGLVTGYQQLSTTRDRIHGYRMALRESGIAFDESLVKTGDFSFESGYELTRDLVTRCKVTALFFASDVMAVGALTFLREAKVKIPKEVAIISCNNFKWTEVTNPSLSVIEQPSYEIGEKAAQVLLGRIRHHDKTGKFKEYRIPTKVVLRESFSME